MSLPDVVSDNITDTAHRRGYIFVEQVFYEAAKDNGYTGLDLKDRSVALHRLWQREGYDPLPSWVKDYCLRSCEQSHGH